MKIRFLADVNFNRRIVRGVVNRNPAVMILIHEFVGIGRSTDHQVLELAAEQGLVLLTHDLGFEAAVRARLAKELHCAGVLIVNPRLTIGDAIDDLLLIWSASDAADWRDRVAWLPL